MRFAFVVYKDLRIGFLLLKLDLNFYTQLMAEIRVLIMNSRS